jgi:hypothetical protein
MGLKHAAMLAMAALLSAACGTVGLPGVPGNTITSRYSDPTGDASATGGTAYDVTQVITNRIDNPPGGAYDTLQVTITFNQTVVLPPPGSVPDSIGTQLANLIHIDTDRNAATGVDSICGLEGFDFVVHGNTTRLANGNYPVFTGPAPSTFSGEATPSVAGNVLTVTIPLSALGGDDGETNLVELAAQRFGGFDNFTDCAPGDPVAGTGGAVVTRQPAGSKGLKSR